MLRLNVPRESGTPAVLWEEEGKSVNTKISVVCLKTEYESEARELAEKIAAPLFFSEKECSVDVSSHVVRFDEDGVSLWGDGLSYRGDYSSMAGRLKHNNLTHELLVKASKIKGRDKSGQKAAVNAEGKDGEKAAEKAGEHSAEKVGEKDAGYAEGNTEDYAAGSSGESFNLPVAIDATAGMGEDSLLLAAAGFRVLLIEKDPIIAALLRDTIRRASNNPGLKDVVARMTVCEKDSKDVLKGISDPKYEYAAGFSTPDVIYLDPMFPEKTKNSLTKKKFQLIHCLESPCSDEDELLGAALSCGCTRIVIKRPLKGPFLGNIKPSYSLTGKTVRYDCLVGKTGPDIQ